MKIPLRIFFVLLGLLLPTGNLLAQLSIPQSQSYFNKPANGGDLYTFNKFNGPGILTKVDIVATGSIDAKGTTDFFPASFDVNASLNIFGFQGNANTPPIAGTLTLQPTTIGLGTSTVLAVTFPQTYGPLNFFNQISLAITDPAQLAAFNGSGTFSYQLLSSTTASATAPVTLHPADVTSGEINIVYTYQVPEPVAASLLGLATMGLWTRSRQPSPRRK